MNVGDMSSVQVNDPSMSIVARAEALPPLPQLPADARARIDDALHHAQSENTSRAYRSDWHRFERWCTDHGYTALPAHELVVAHYLTAAAAEVTEPGEHVYSASTLTRWVQSINYWHRRARSIAADPDTPEPLRVSLAACTPPGSSQTVKDVLSGIRRQYATKGDRPVQRRDPLLVDDLHRIVIGARTAADTWQKRVAERRDSALLLTGFAGALRRSELAALTVGAVRPHRDGGLRLQLPRSKGYQEGGDPVVPLPAGRHHHTCPPCAHLRWLQVLDAHHRRGRAGVIALLRTDDHFTTHVCGGAQPTFGATTRDERRAVQVQPLYRSVRQNGVIGDTAIAGSTVHAILTRNAAAVGIDTEMLGGHSLRVGFVTQARRNGADTHQIQRQTRHKSTAMIDLYTREHDALADNAVTDIGL